MQFQSGLWLHSDGLKIFNAWKRSGNRKLSEFLFEMALSNITRPSSATAILFIPSTRKRTYLLKRNPAKEWAHFLGKKWNLPVFHRSIEIAEKSNESKTLNLENRLLKSDRFRAPADAELIQNKNEEIILVDDLMTTGNTLRRAVLAISNLGNRSCVQRIHVVTLGLRSR
jgi:predicted amidophosphoribosyltransferase